MSDAYTELVERVRAEHAEIDGQINALRENRALINYEIKALNVRKVQIARLLKATQSHKKAGKVDGS